MSAEEYLKRIKEEFPEVTWKEYELLTHGWDHAVVILDEQLAFRFPKNDEYKDEFSEEIRLLAYLKDRLSVRIPEYRYIAKDRSFAGYTLVPGKELTRSKFEGLSKEDQDDVAKQLAQFLSELHATPRSIEKEFNIRIDDEDHDKFVPEIREIVFPKLSEYEIGVIEDFFEELKATLDHTYVDVLTHSDLSDDHILWDDTQKQINIIDFSDRVFTDPAADFAGLTKISPKLRDRVFELYTGKKDEGLLERAELYFKQTGIVLMKHGLTDQQCTFEEGYKVFTRRFGINKS